MVSHLKQLYDQMAQLSYELQHIQARWNQLMRQVQQISEEPQEQHGRGGFSGPMVSIKQTSSYGAQYTAIGSDDIPSGRSNSLSGLSEPTILQGKAPGSPFQIRDERVSRQSEHMSYTRTN